MIKGGDIMNDDWTEWIGKRCKIFIRNLSDRPIIYTGTIISVKQQFLTIIDKMNNTVTINLQDIIQIRGEEEWEREERLLRENREGYKP